NINATNCYAIGAESVHAGKFTLVSDEDTFINSYLSTFNSNKGESTNWSIKDNNMPMLKDLALLECDFSNYESAAEYGNSPMAASNWTRITDGGNKYLHGDLGNNVSTQNASFVIVPNDATGNGSSHTGYYTWGVNGPVKPGRIYRLAFKAKCSQASTMNYNLLFGYGYGAGSNNRGEHYDYSNYDFYNRSSAALTTSWQNFSTYFTAEYYPNNGGGTNRVIFQIDQNGMRNRTVDFDDFVITEVSGVAFKVDDNKYSAPCVAYDGDSIVLPEDPTRNGYFFEGWDTDEGNTSALNTATEKVGNVKIAYAHWRKTFVSHSLVLNDSIGLNFFVDLGGLTAEQRNASYMTFTITKGDSDTVDGKQVDFASAFAGETAGYYGFTYYLSSVQMAESITPTFHYGNGETHVGDPYAITDYIDYVNANSDKYDDNVVDLVNAMGNYGYYAQQYFTDITCTSMASDYKKSNYAADAYTSRKNYVSDKAITQNLSGITNGGSVGQFQYTLNLNSTTSILIKFHTANVTIAATKGGNDYTDRKNAYTASDCTLYLLHLPISQLGDNITVSGKVNGNNYSMQISGLTYVYGVLNSGNTSTALKNLASALCDYYTLARAYAGGVAAPSYLTSDYM
ncbi:MAG: InlB B-repeat-containing protein, partial [Clostridia bacterium]|nr:InlB B-repeat-containing protein [Clostridia bacterium]